MATFLQIETWLKFLQFQSYLNVSTKFNAFFYFVQILPAGLERHDSDERRGVPNAWLSTEGDV